MKHKIGIPVLLILALAHNALYCQDGTRALHAEDTNLADQQVESGIDLFGSEDLLNVSLCFDMRGFVRSKNEPEYFDAILSIKTNDHDSVSQHIRIKARGFMRLDYCSFPPIMLNFKNQGSNQGDILDGGKIKLVTHCNTSSQRGNYILKEYLTYKLYNIITPYSFKTRLIRITYVDINQSVKTVTSYGFLIEDKNDMAERNHAVLVDNKNLNQKHMRTSDMVRNALFNYMIGNTDWSVPGQHNVKVIKSLDLLTDKAIPVMYDFDFSGLVGTSYAAPAEALPIKTVFERYYLGVCVEDTEFQPVVNEYMALQDSILQTVRGFEFLDDPYKRQVESYLDNFYKAIDNQRVILSDVRNTCKSF